jgi:glyoxylase-like metal-dependent hydrolase (beta-lactamase superfamily II)
MARRSEQHPRNADGDLYVDQSCIDCDTCARLAPATFARDEATASSFVARQPAEPAERLRAHMALVSCPVAAIGTSGSADEVRAAAQAFPVEIAPGAGVYDCGFASKDSYGASSWLVVRPGGNVLVDSPRAAAPLLRQIDALGGVQTMFLTHRDDVADHAAFRARYGCERVIHARDATFPVERQIEGDAPVRLGDDLLVVPVPGHTAGSAALLVGDRFLFTGDHLWGDGDGGLAASRSVCWWSWEAQRRSMAHLRALSFEWVLPGHGAPLYAAPERMRGALERLIARM